MTLKCLQCNETLHGIGKTLLLIVVNGLTRHMHILLYYYYPYPYLSWSIKMFR